MNRVASQLKRQAITSFPPASGLFQRQRACGQHTSADDECEEREQKPEGTLQRAAINPSPAHDVPPIVHEALRSPGQPLDTQTRALMESRFGHNFSQVRVHTDAQAVESARSVNALAFTVGRDVVFGAGQYAPQTNAGRRLMAHELTHVVQQTGAETQGLQRAGAEDEEKEKLPVEASSKAPADATPTGAGTTPAAATAAVEVTDGAIDALDLAPAAKAAAKELKTKHPEVTFTSGRRGVSEQASAMASNIISSKDRKWIEKTYASAAALQKWVDDNPEATSQKDIAAGLEKTMTDMSDAGRGKISKHLSGEAFDVQPQEKDAEAIKKDIQALSGLSKFLDKEGGLVRWHAQFKKVGNVLAGYDHLEQEADRMAERVVHSPAAIASMLPW